MKKAINEWAFPDAWPMTKVMTVARAAGFDGLEVALVKFDNGVIGKVTTNFDCVNPYQFPFRIFGDRGSVFDNRIWSHKYKRWRCRGWKNLPSSKLYDELGLVNLISLIPSLGLRKRRSDGSGHANLQRGRTHIPRRHLHAARGRRE